MFSFFFFFFYFFQLTVSAFLYSFNRMAFLKDRMLSLLLCFARDYVLVGCWRDVTAITIMGVKTSRCSLCALVFLPLSQVGACSGCWQHLFVVCPALSLSHISGVAAFYSFVIASHGIVRDTCLLSRAGLGQPRPLCHAPSPYTSRLSLFSLSTNTA